MPASKSSTRSPQRTSIEEVLPRVRAVRGPEQAMEPRTPQNFTLKATINYIGKRGRDPFRLR